MMEDWTDIIGEELENIEEPLPADDWSVLQQKYAAAQKRKKAAAFAWAGGITSVAAAVALVLLLVRPDANPAIPDNITADIPDNIISVIPDQIGDLNDLVHVDSTVVSAPTDTISAIAPPVQKKSSVPVAVVTKPVEDVRIAENRTEVIIDEEDEEVFDVVPDTTSLKDKLLADASTSYNFEELFDDEPIRKRRQISIGLSGSTSDSPIMKVFDAAMPECPSVPDEAPPVEPDDTLGISNPQPEMSMMRARSEYTDTYRHEIPVSFGVSARIHLDDRIYLTTGLNYTRYASTRTRRYIATAKQQSDKQYVHYLGIPVRLDYMAVNRKHFNLYLGAGVQMDKCIYATVGNERLHEKQWLFGVNGTMGLQVNLVPRVGLYFEPEVSYALNEGSIETFRSGEPFVITVRGGLRFNF